MPITSFALGTWQIYRLKWKKGLIERYSENLRQEPIILPTDIGYPSPSKILPPLISSSVYKLVLMYRDHTVEELDHRTVLIRGKFRHDQEMLVGPRTRDGILGYHIITPIERDNGSSLSPHPPAKVNVRQPVLVNRGWIAQMFAQRANRPASIDPNTTIIKGLGTLNIGPQLMEVRAPPGGNVFTPRNDFAHGKFYSVNVKEMAEWTGSQPLLIEQTFGPPHPTHLPSPFVCLF
jgi:surfeit locus 1 family protein